jgi:hypothetical protein
MIEKKKEDEEYRRYRYSDIGYIQRIQRAKKEYTRQYDSLTGKPQEGLKIHLDFYYLLNTDFDWVTKLVRDSIVEIIQEYQSKEKLKLKKRTFLTFNIEQVSTEKCIDILFTPGVIDPELLDMLKILGLNIVSIFIYDTIQKLKNKGLKLIGRNNLKKAKCPRTKFIRHSDGTIEYIEEKDEFEFE